MMKYLAIICLLVFIAGNASAGITADKTQNTVSANLTNVSIAEAVRQLSHAAGIRIFLDKSISRTVTSEFSHLPIEAAVKRLTGPELNTAFIFVKEKTGSGAEVFRLDTVKIYDKGNRLSENFMVFDPSMSEDKAKQSATVPASSGRPTRIFENIEREIILTQKNLELLHQKQAADANALTQRIAELKRRLSQHPSPDERTTLAEKLHQAEERLSEVNRINALMIADEERRLTELTEEQRQIESRKKFMERQRESEKRRTAPP